ncbi:hydroxyproline dehydrogenase-like [Lineus longissimus]|uniref:hydroxyproline dehydrogenase-like n=1 Tax=Lineus longissimus TaxID=88925 RepID=UPI00315CF361
MFQTRPHLPRYAQLARIIHKRHKGEALLKCPACTLGCHTIHSKAADRDGCHLHAGKSNSLDPTRAATPIDIDNVDYHRVFATKTLTDLVRAISVLRICSSDTFVTNALKLYTTSHKIFGKRLVDVLTRHTFYKQFVGGEDVEALERTILNLQTAGIGSILAVPMEEDRHEGDSSTTDRTSWYDQNRDTTFRCVKFAHEFQPEYPMYQLKVTAFLPGDLVTKITKILKSKSSDEIPVESIAKTISSGEMVTYSALSTRENDDFHLGLIRLREIGQLSEELKVRVLVDAEYTYMNPAISLVALAMMLNYNQESPLVWNTYQCYLKQTYHNMNEDYQFIKAQGVGFGVKLVRGAYMYNERVLAEKDGYPSPVHDTYEDTCTMYNKSLNKLLELIKERSPVTNLIIASHNEYSVKFAVKRINELGLDTRSGEIFFGQLLGMSDQITYPLGQAKYLVYKSLPYGSIDDTIPYLVRRAQENRSVMAGVRRELNVLQTATKSRMKSYFRST